MFGGNLILQPAYENQKLIFSMTYQTQITLRTILSGLVFTRLTQEMLDYIYESTKLLLEIIKYFLNF